MRNRFNSTNAELHVVMYHYVRDLPRSRYPKIKGMMLDEFSEQVAWFTSHYEMAPLEVALAFLQGSYRPTRDLCVFTFDDGLVEHFSEVAPILADYKIQGLFGVITSCVEDHLVAPVHMNHFLMAEMDFEAYRSAFMQRLRDTNAETLAGVQVDPKVAQRSYPLDTLEVATFKFLFNFALDAGVRDVIVKSLFEEYIGDQQQFAKQLYMSWEEIRQLQQARMLIAGHTHLHRPLSKLTTTELNADLTISRRLLNQRLAPQALWPFSYPYGKKTSYSADAIALIQRLGYDCAFNTEYGVNAPGTPVFELHRADCKNAIPQLHT